VTNQELKGEPVAQGDLVLEEDVVKELMLEKHPSEAPLALNKRARGKHPSP